MASDLVDAILCVLDVDVDVDAGVDVIVLEHVLYIVDSSSDSIVACTQGLSCNILVEPMIDKTYSCLCMH